MGDLEVRPVTAAIGAEIRGVDLRTPLRREEIDAIERALHEYVVVFFRDQDITPDEQVEFASQFGEISIPPFTPKYPPPRPELIVLDQTEPRGDGADRWHSDNTFMTEPPMGSVLKAVRLPSVGGDTCFANMFAAWDALSAPLREMLEGLTATHDITRPLERGVRGGHVEQDVAAIRKEWPPVDHPVARRHPVTGRLALFVNSNSTVRINGLGDAESDAVLHLLLEHVRSPEFQCRFHWDTNSIAFWDNRSAQHYAVPDYHERRIMHRVTIAGDRPA
jgi:taurine dioxygenase